MAFAAPLIPLLPTLLTAGSAVVGAVSAIQSGNYQAAVAKNNARIAEENAARTSEAAQIEAQRSDQDYRALLGEQLAAQGASGLDILGRSQQSARMLTKRTGRRAAMAIVDEGEAGARRSLQESANFRSEGKQARLQGYLTGGARLLQGASDVGTLVRGRRPRSFERRRR
jgi:hypothetical protein